MLILLVAPFIGGLAVMWLESEERAMNKTVARLVKQSRANDKRKRYYR